MLMSEEFFHKFLPSVFISSDIGDYLACHLAGRGFAAFLFSGIVFKTKPF